MTGLAGLSQLIDTTSKTPRPDRDPNMHVDVAALVGEHLVSLRFRAIDPEEWARRTYESTPQPGVEKDQTFKYNVREVAKDVAQVSGYLVDEDRPEEFIPATTWAELWPILSGPTRVDIFNAVFILNQGMPQMRTIAAKKARLRTLEQSADSPESLESHPAGSAGGSPVRSSKSSGTSKDASPASSPPASPSGTANRSPRSSPRAKKTGTGDRTASR
ncbi:hypothetical protein [Rathayibacter sp. VKM Ac-2630]|uniref:hypothetical protein n=1 Tax=Rathayibacter sp. VKM Ac-2630 TaxID=1938617 RepID=UPI0009813DEF|nr:hypothetical protein [Rathayibacter sp. VKM Ac-2630]OOB91188.1 hypothetical protein B0T42_07250 [Rathayibacter sp. VKM Ac-2630]